MSSNDSENVPSYRKNEITDEDLFDVPELEDDQHDDSDGHEGPPIDIEDKHPEDAEEREGN